MKKLLIALFSLFLVSYIIELKKTNESLYIDNEILSYENLELQNKIIKLTKKPIIKQPVTPIKVKKVKKQPKKVEEPKIIIKVEEPLIEPVIIDDTIN